MTPSTSSCNGFSTSKIAARKEEVEKEASVAHSETKDLCEALSEAREEDEVGFSGYSVGLLSFVLIFYFQSARRKGFEKSI